MKHLFYVTIPFRLSVIITVLLSVYFVNFYNGDDKYVYEGEVTNLSISNQKDDNGNKKIIYYYTYIDIHGFEYTDSLITKYGEYNFIIENLKVNNKVYIKSKKCSGEMWAAIIIIELAYALFVLFGAILIETDTIIMFLPIPLYFMTDQYREIEPYNDILLRLKKFLGYEK